MSQDDLLGEGDLSTPSIEMTCLGTPRMRCRNSLIMAVNERLPEAQSLYL